MSLPRSISSADLQQTERCQDFIRKDRKRAEGPDAPVNYFNASPRFTLTIPSLYDYKDEKFRQFVFKRVINYTIKEDLERSKTINWCRGASNVVPLYTTGDGNCLLHAASLGMWGFQDRNYTLRKSIHTALENGKNNGLHKRWIEWRRNENRKFGFSLDPHQWDKEWDDEVKFASTEKVNHGSLGYLDEFHVFVLSNVLRRPVFLYSPPKLLSQDEGVTLQVVEFYGLYLPLLWNPDYCIKGPLPIVYNNGHFSALTIIDGEREYTDGCLLFPLCDCYYRDLPIRFMNERENAVLLKDEYLQMTVLRDSRRDIPCAKLLLTDRPKYIKPLLEGFIQRCLEAYPKDMPKDEALGSSGTCRNKCGFNGSFEYNGYCSKCFKRESASNPYQGASDPYQGASNWYQKPSDPYQRERGQEYMNPRDEMEVSSVTCNNNCNRLGFAMYLGMCKDCYERKRGKDKESDRPQPQSQVIPPISQITSSLLEKSSETRACRTRGCDFFGKAATNFYCSQCFEKNLEDILGSSDLPESRNSNNPRPSSASNFEPPRDRKEEGERPKCSNCRNFFANPEYGDLCSACFKEKTKKEANKTAPLQQSDPPYQQDVHGTTAPHERRDNWRGRDEDEARRYAREDQRRYEADRERERDRQQRDEFRRERENYNNREMDRERDRRAGDEYYNYDPPREGHERERNSGERRRVQSRERNEHNSGERNPGLYSKERQYSDEGRRPYSGERNRPHSEYNDVPGGRRRDEDQLDEGKRDQYYHEKEREKTRRRTEDMVCILCDLNAPISKMNGICDEHARKCRLTEITKSRSPLLHRRREEDEVEPREDRRIPEKRLCRSPGCSYSPVPSYDNYCVRCYQENQRKYGKRINTALDSFPHRRREEDEVEPHKDKRIPEKRLCKSPGCSYFPVPSYDNYCANCYEENRKKYYSKRIKCSTDGCSNESTRNGFCDRCYKERYPPTDSPQYDDTKHPLAPSSQFEGTERRGHSPLPPRNQAYIRRSSEPQVAQYDHSPSNHGTRFNRLRSLSQEDESERERESERGRAEYFRTRPEEEDYRRREFSAERRANNHYDRDRDFNDRQKKQFDLI